MEYTLNRTVSLNEAYEVIVCGGGPAGCAAAISAAREGAKTLLIETSGMLGGMSTLGLVNALPHSIREDRVIYGGIAEKIASQLRPYMEDWRNNNHGWLPIDFEQLKLIYDEMVTSAGADVLFYSHVAGVEMKDDRNIDVVLVANKAGITAYRAKVFIDCTGDADLYAWAGKEYIDGNGKGQYMAGTMCFALTGVKDGKIDEAYARYDPEEGHHRRKYMVAKIFEDGKYHIGDRHFVPRKFGDGAVSFNAGHVYGLNALDPVSLSEGTMEGRRIANDWYKALKEYAPEAFSESILVQTAPSVGIRESRRIIGDYVFTVEDYLARAVFPDEVYRGRYHVDVHDEDITQDSRTDLVYEQLGHEESYGVPYRVMCPRDLDNVLVAGRTMSSDRMANGCLRVMSSCMCAGEACGMAAKYAADMENVNIHKVDTQVLRKRLMEEGAVLPKQETDTF